MSGWFGIHLMCKIQQCHWETNHLVAKFGKYFQHLAMNRFCWHPKPCRTLDPFPPVRMNIFSSLENPKTLNRSGHSGFPPTIKLTFVPCIILEYWRNYLCEKGLYSWRLVLVPATFARLHGTISTTSLNQTQSITNNVICCNVLVTFYNNFNLK